MKKLATIFSIAFLPSFLLAQKADSLFATTERYFENKDYSNAIRYTKKSLRTFSPRVPITKQCMDRESMNRRMHKRIICSKLADYYAEANQPDKAVKYLKKIDRKYNYHFCGAGATMRTEMLYKQILELEKQLRNERQVRRYE